MKNSISGNNMNYNQGQGPGMCPGRGGGCSAAPPEKPNVLNELKCADQRAQSTAKAIEKMREFIDAQAKKPCLNDDDAKELQEKQCELMEKMSEFEEITKQIQRLVAMSDGQCPPARLTAPEEKLPKVIICSGCPEDEIPKIIVCESTKKDGKKPPLYQQFPGKPAYSPCGNPPKPARPCGGMNQNTQRPPCDHNRGNQGQSPCKSAFTAPQVGQGCARQSMGFPCVPQRVPTKPIGGPCEGGGTNGGYGQQGGGVTNAGYGQQGGGGTNGGYGQQGGGGQFGGGLGGLPSGLPQMGGHGGLPSGLPQMGGGHGGLPSGLPQMGGRPYGSMPVMNQVLSQLNSYSNQYRNGPPNNQFLQTLGGNNMGRGLLRTPQMGGFAPMGCMGAPMGQMGTMPQMGMMGQQRGPPMMGLGGCGGTGYGGMKPMGAMGPPMGGITTKPGAGGCGGGLQGDSNKASEDQSGQGAAPKTGCGSVYTGRKSGRTLSETPKCSCSGEKKDSGGCGGRTTCDVDGEDGALKISCGDGGGGGKEETKSKLSSGSIAGPGGDNVPEVAAGPSGTNLLLPVCIKQIAAAPMGVNAPLVKETIVVNHLTDQLETSYKLQEKLVIENAEMEGTRFQLQQQLMCKDQAVDNLKKKVENLQNEMRQVCNENNELKNKIAADNAPLFPDKPLCKAKLANQPVCKMDLYNQMGIPVPKTSECLGDGGGAEATRTMEVMVASMEEEVRSMQKELELVQQERRNLELQRKLLKCTAPGTCQRAAQPAAAASGGCQKQQTQAMNTCPIPSCPPPPAPPPPPPCVVQLQCQIQQMKEQYCKLQEDFHKKVEEVSCLRLELENAKKESQLSLEKTEEAEARVDDLLDRLKSVESEKTKMSNSKDQLMEMEQQLILAKQRYREAQEELEEQRTNVQEQGVQLEDYRQKYLCAQQTVEEQRRQMDILELENCRIGEQVNVEIQRVKASFQEKLQELTPLPEILKATQLKLQECSQLRIIAERNCEELGKEVDELKEANDRLSRCLDEIKNNTNQKDAEKASLQSSLTDGEKKMEETKTENLKLKAVVARLEELAVQNERKYEEKVHECLQLQTQLETLREESARQVSRTKDRCESARRSLQTQISEMEKQLAQSRAAARSAQRDRDEIRQKMQAQICQLNENFDQAQLRIRTLQSHVNYLKTSYTNIFNPDDRHPCASPNIESCSPAIEGKDNYF